MTEDTAIEDPHCGRDAEVPPPRAEKSRTAVSHGMISRQRSFAMRHLLLLLALLCLSSCALFHSGPPPKAMHVMYEWDDDKGPGDISVEIDLSSQIATYRRGDRTIGWSFVSTGKEGHSTSPGSYKVTEMMEVKLSDRYGWITDPAGNVSNGDAKPTTPVPEGHTYHPAAMQHWMRLTWYGVGMHAGEIPRPGEAASHGCIRLPKDFVPKLYEVAKVGTPVKIIKTGVPKAELPPRAQASGSPPEHSPSHRRGDQRDQASAVTRQPRQVR